MLLHWSLVAIHSQAPPSSAIISDSPEHTQTMFCFLEEAYTGYHVSSTEPLTQTAIPETLRRSLTSPAQSASVITKTQLCGVPAIPGTSKITTHNHVARRIPNQISQQTLDVDFVTSGSCADVSGQLTDCVFDVRTTQPELSPKQLSVTALSSVVQHGRTVRLKWLLPPTSGFLRAGAPDTQI